MSTVPEAERTQPVPTVPQDPDRAPHSIASRTARTTASASGQAEQRRRFGGVRWGSAFFGWLTATAMAVLLTALAAGVGAAAGFGTPGGPAGAVDAATRDPAAARTLGVTGAVVLLAVLLVAYYCGGYVAGRMARFSGAKQGLAVWLWALVVAAVAAAAGSVAGVAFDALAALGALPPIPLGDGELTTAGIATAVGALVVSLVGAVLGGLGGMRYHRRVDRAVAEPI
jgi:hypothetical protein